jgi:hypothetical protein
MTDFAPEAAVDAAIADGAAESPASTGSVDWEQKYRAEVQDRIKERERYKPIAQTFGNMHPDDAKAIQDFISAYSSGDTETATRWMIDNARTLAGDRWTDYISPAQQENITNQAVSEGQQAGLSPDQVEQLIEQRMNQYQQMQVQQQYERQIEDTLLQHGYDPNTPLATAAIVAASKRSDLDLSAAIRELEDQVLAQAQTIASRRSDAASQMGTPVVNGVAAVNPNGQNLTPRQRAMARLEQNGL